MILVVLCLVIKLSIVNSWYFWLNSNLLQAKLVLVVNCIFMNWIWASISFTFWQIGEPLLNIGLKSLCIDVKMLWADWLLNFLLLGLHEAVSRPYNAPLLNREDWGFLNLRTSLNKRKLMIINFRSTKVFLNQLHNIVWNFFVVFSQKPFNLLFLIMAIV